MRGRSLLREPCSQNFCALCVHRLKATHPPSHVQRRFIQSTRPTFRPPPDAASATTRNDGYKGDGGREPTKTPSGTLGTDNTSLGWGRPGDNNQTPTAPGRPEASKSGFGKTASEAARAAYMAKPIALSPQEQRARDLLRQQEEAAQARIVKINAGPGPSSNRAGRPDPEEYRSSQPQQRDPWTRDHRTAQQSGPQPAQRSAQGEFPIRRGSHQLGDAESKLSDASSRGPQESGWTGLRRRLPVADNLHTTAPTDTFAAAQSLREQQSAEKAYTPLGRRSLPDTHQNKNGADGHQFKVRRSNSTLPQDRNDEARHGDLSGRSFGRNGERLPAESANSTGQRVGQFSAFQSEAPHTTSSRTTESAYASGRLLPRLQGFGNPRAETVANEPQEKDDEDEPAYSQKPAHSQRSQASSKYQPVNKPRGKDKDKARRAQKFAADEDDVEDDLEQRRKEVREQRKREKAAKKAAEPVPILLPEYISVSSLATALKVRFEEFVEKIESLGFEETAHDHILNAETAGLIAQEYNFEPIIDRDSSADLKARPPPEDPSLLPQRPPVVTIMGHVDHGKTTLLDWLRKSSVAATEHGGITQHIGAFSVPMPGGKLITFLDTPGHAAFLSMRQRGANVTDIVILVVAADDSVKPQTIEAINHAKAAKVPMIVAVNKIDKEDSDVNRVKQDLARYGVEIEDFGGDTQVICVSGKTGQGMEDLEEAAVTLSEILDMRAEVDGQAEGWILEASIKTLGKAATVLVRRGTIRQGDFIVAGTTWARVRTLRNEAGVIIEEAPPGTPVQIDGWKDLPLAGDEVIQAIDEAQAKKVVDIRLEKEEREKLALDMEAINDFRREVDETRERIKQDAIRAAEAEKAEGASELPRTPEAKPGGPKNIYFIVKGDVSGSVEAVVDSISGIGNGEVQPYILRSGVGKVSEFDIEHAAAAKGHVISFNTPIDEEVSSLAKYAKVTILDNNVIYRLVDDVKRKLSEYLAPLITQRVLGEAEIAQVFEITVKGRTTKAVAGCKVRNGVIGKNAKIRVLRDGEKVFDGMLASLKNIKKDVMEMRKGTECGIGFENWFDFQVGDQIQAYEEKEEKRYL